MPMASQNGNFIDVSDENPTSQYAYIPPSTNIPFISQPSPTSINHNVPPTSTILHLLVTLHNLIHPLKLP